MSAPYLPDGRNGDVYRNEGGAWQATSPYPGNVVIDPSELDCLPPESIIRLRCGMAAWKQNGIDWYVSNDEDDPVTGEQLKDELPALILWPVIDH